MPSNMKITRIGTASNPKLARRAYLEAQLDAHPRLVRLAGTRHIRCEVVRATDDEILASAVASDPDIAIDKALTLAAERLRVTDQPPTKNEAVEKRVATLSNESVELTQQLADLKTIVETQAQQIAALSAAEKEVMNGTNL